MNRSIPTWKVEYLVRLASLSNSALLDEVLEMSIPDDYDGVFTARGSWKYETALDELKTRLTAKGFLP